MIKQAKELSHGNNVYSRYHYSGVAFGVMDYKGSVTASRQAPEVCNIENKNNVKEVT